MIKVQVRPNEPLEAALRRFKRQCNYAGVFRLAKKHSFHEKRSDKRRREERERIRNIQRAMRKAKGPMRKTKRRKSKIKARPTESQDDSTETKQDGAASAEAKPVVERTEVTERVATPASSQVASE